MTAAAALRIFPVRWPEISAGDDLARLLVEAVELRSGQIVVLTSKAVSKAAGRVVTGERTEWIAAESRRVVARRGEAVIAETNSGLVLAAAGVDSSNLPPGKVALLPVDADAAARSLRDRILEASGRNVGVILSDTAGRAWRVGQCDLAIGCAGVSALLDLRGTLDSFDQVLDVTMPAVADEIAAAADLVKGKATGCPVAVVCGLDELVLPPGESGSGAGELVRPADADLFGLGSRDAVVAVLQRGEDDQALRHFPRLSADEEVPFEDLAPPGRRHDVSILVVRSGAGDQRTWTVQVDVREDAPPEAWLFAGGLLEKTRALAASHRLTPEPAPQQPLSSPGWRAVDSTVWRTP